MAAIKAPLHPSKESHFYDQAQGRYQKRGREWGRGCLGHLSVLFSHWGANLFLHESRSKDICILSIAWGATTYSTKNNNKETNNSANNIAWTCFLWERLLVAGAHPAYIFNNGRGRGGSRLWAEACRLLWLHFSFRLFKSMLFICWPFTEKTPQLQYKNYDGNRFASFCFPCFFNLLLLCCCYCCCFLKIVHNALNAKRCLDGARPLASQSQTVACLSPSGQSWLPSQSPLPPCSPLALPASGLCGVAN